MSNTQWWLATKQVPVDVLRQHAEFTAVADCPACTCTDIHPFVYTASWRTGEEGELMCGTPYRWVRRCCTRCGYGWLQR